MSKAVATVRISNGVVNVMKWCYNCGFYEWAVECENHRFRCLNCGKDTRGKNYYIDKHVQVENTQESHLPQELYVHAGSRE